MHELSLLKDLLNKIRQIAQQQQPNQLTSVTVELGALAHISAEHFRQHFETAVIGTDLERVDLTVICNDDIHAPTAQDIVLTSVELTTADD
ncbi:hydrogenase maturation nickel metallochaperone HypA [Aestuariicella hydrocarbonica]|uniref:Hydrogenase maturation nickel metallochaperone HypA n=1 Tax=Pseudomaricurvus hydrocarbonicus TaxID=1470433 RepID=A0A9E5MN34_9GAMM|nr:hydrogenase/urease maturation nickel metallochaperone HypA [Aestuariicella hydrocarbonica]NHO67303.1 hydrogenase maturation nickel metallochaperone HypA [Aestuariicella hydrocarbonica]